MASRNIYIENESAKMPAPLANINFDDRHYLPILKTKEGELWALGNTGAARKPFITPLLELHVGPPNRTSAQHIDTVCEQIKQAWGKRRFFLDTHLYGQTSTASAALCVDALQAVAAENMNFVPVLSMKASPNFCQQIRPYVDKGTGLLLRLRSGDFVDVGALQESLSDLLTSFSLTPNQVDVLIDYEAVTEEAVMTQLLRTHVNQLPYVKHWRTLSTAGSSFPSSVANQSAHVWNSLPRREWESWRTAGSGFALLRNSTYGDYGVRDNQPPVSMGFPYPNIRYTSNGTFLVRRHDVLVKDGGSAGIRVICKSLLQHPAWRGAAFSEGDARIIINADPQQGPGNAGNWTAWGMNHHFASVVDEIQSLPLT